VEVSKVFDLLIKNARVVTEEAVQKKNVAVKDGIIAAILPCSEVPEAEKTEDISDKYLLPGGVDDHVHFNEPGYTWREDFAHASSAAAIGGITTVIDMPMQNEPAVADAEIFQKKEVLLQGKSVIDYGFWGALVHTNEDALAGMDKEGALAFKCFMCDPGKSYTELRLTEIEKVLIRLKTFDGLAGFHCEDYEMIKTMETAKIAAGKISRKDYLEARPPKAEIKAVRAILSLVRKTGGKAHICHVSHPAVAALVREAKAEGLAVTAETCMHYLLFTERDLIDKGTLFKCSPPLRTAENAEELWHYVLDGTIDCICSDHSPAKLEEKAEDGPYGTFGAWGGISGVQSGMQTFWNYAVNKKHVSPSLLAKALCANPARIFGIYERKGAVKAGFDADFVVLDADADWEITAESLAYKNKISAFCGQKGKGLPVMTFVRGRLVCKNGKIEAPSTGRLLRKN